MPPPFAALLLGILAAAVAAGCGGGDPPTADPTGRSAEAPASVREAGADRSSLTPELARLVDESGELLEGGATAFEARLDELEGHPVVVNKWASWCGPCRAEFPFFAAQAEERAGEVAFLGVDSSDSDADAASFLDEFPVPYPSYKDPDLEVAEAMDGVAAWPTTTFYDADGELVYVKQGGYASEELLAEDIERYAE